MEEIKVKRGLTNENIKKLFKWEDTWSEMAWIAFFICLILIVASYRMETNVCKEMIQDNCFQQCKMNEVIKSYEEQGLHILYCDNSTFQCFFVDQLDVEKEMRDLINSSFSNLSNGS